MSIYTEAVNRMPKEHIDHHCSDLYLKVCEESEQLVKNYDFKGNVRRFTSRIDNTLWFDIPFAFDPYWSK